MTDPKTILDFWLGDSIDGPEAAARQHKMWYRGGVTLDQEIRQRFDQQILAARSGDLQNWEETAEGALALVILLDQFTRNIFRRSLDAYSGDKQALAITKRAIRKGYDKLLPVTGSIFLYHPLHHSEALTDQNQAVELLETLQRESPAEWHDYLQRSIEGFSRHRDVIARFGRFPHRNRVLGRENTAEEDEYLAAGADSYGQG